MHAERTAQMLDGGGEQTCNRQRLASSRARFAMDGCAEAYSDARCCSLHYKTVSSHPAGFASPQRAWTESPRTNMLSGTDCLVRKPLCEILLNLQTLGVRVWAVWKQKVQ